MTDSDEMPDMRARVVGRGPPVRVTTVRLPRIGGRYSGASHVRFWPVSIRDVDFSGVRFDQFLAEGTRFIRCNFTDSQLEGSFGVRHQTRFEHCVFVATSMSGVDPGQARFIACRFENANMFRWDALAAEFVDCEFSGVLSECNFWGKPSDDWIERGLKPRRATNEFRGNDFQAAELLSVAFKGGIDIRAQRWPAGPEYITLDRLQERIRRARPIVGRWADDERAEAELMLEIYSTGGYEEQDELFAHRWELGVPRAVADRVWCLLEGID
jgi:hypothetical protein